MIGNVGRMTMKTTRSVLAFAVLLMGVVTAGQAFAQGRHPGPYRGGHWHTSVGFYIGVPVGGFPYYYPPFHSPYYYPAYYPAPVVIQQQPTVYVEQNPQPAAQPQVQSPAPSSAYWYYCADSRAYYPYVRECPAGWQRVAPQPG
jgi:hypothetical protein